MIYPQRNNVDVSKSSGIKDLDKSARVLPETIPVFQTVQRHFSIEFHTLLLYSTVAKRFFDYPLPFSVNAY